MPPQAASVAGGVTRVASAAASGRLFPAGQPVLPVFLRLVSLVMGLALLARLCSVLVASSAMVIRARRRQRALLALLARGDPKAPGALVVDYPAAAAYCLPGLRSRIVVSVGALDLLRPAELAAVLAHERAHLRERHDLVVLPFTALRRAFGWSRICADAHQSVALLIEMLADDRALRARPARALAGALARFGTAGCAENTPAGALAVSGAVQEGEMAARVTRIMTPAPPLGYAVRAGHLVRRHHDRGRARRAAAPALLTGRCGPAWPPGSAGSGYQGPYGPERELPLPVLNSLTLGRTSTR